VERALSGDVTADLLRDIYADIEAVLPPETRARARERRRAAEAGAKAQQRAEREAQRQRKAEERQRNAIVCSANFMVKGVTFNGRADVIARYARAGDTVFLIRDRANIHGRNAIEVRLNNGMQVGYVPKKDAQKLAPLLDEGCRHSALITSILGVHAPVPVVEVTIYENVATVPRAVTEEEVPKTSRPAFNHGIGLALAVLAVLIAVLILIIETRD
jgi:hypothetical protein